MREQGVNCLHESTVLVTIYILEWVVLGSMASFIAYSQLTLMWEVANMILSVKLDVSVKHLCPLLRGNSYLYLIHLNSYSNNAVFKRIYLYIQMVTVLDTMSKN